MKLTHETLVRGNPAQILLPRFTVSQIMRNDQQVSFRIFFTANHQMFDKNDYIVVKYAKVDPTGQPDHNADGNITFYKPPNPPLVPPDNRDRLIFGSLKKEANNGYTIDWSQCQVSEVPQALSHSSSARFSGGHSSGSVTQATRYRSTSSVSRLVSAITPSEAAEQQSTFSDNVRTPYTVDLLLPSPNDEGSVMVDDPLFVEARQGVAAQAVTMSRSLPPMERYEAADKSDSANSNKRLVKSLSPPDTPLATKISSGQPVTIDSVSHLHTVTPATTYETTIDGQTVAVTSQGKPLHRSDDRVLFTEEELQNCGQWLAENYYHSNSPSMFSDSPTGGVLPSPTPPSPSTPSVDVIPSPGPTVPVLPPDSPESGPVIPTLPPDSSEQTPEPLDPPASDIEQTEPPPQRQGNSRFAKVFTMAREGEGNSSDDIDMGDEELRPQPETPRPPNSGPSSTDPPSSNSDQSSTTPPSSSTTTDSSSSTTPPSSSTTTDSSSSTTPPSSSTTTDSTPAPVTPQPIQPIPKPPQPATPHTYTHLQPYVGHYSPGYDTVTGDLVWKVGFGFAGSFDTFEDYVSYLTRPILKRVQDELTSRPGGNGQRMQPDKGEVIDVIAMIAQKRLYFRSNPGYVYCYWGHATPRMLRLFQAPHYFRNHHCAHLYWYLVCATPHNTMLKDDTYRILIGRHVFPKRGEEVIVSSLEPIVIPGNSFFNPMGIEIRDENDELYDLQIPYIIEWSFTPFTAEVSTPPPGSLSCAT